MVCLPCDHFRAAGVRRLFAADGMVVVSGSRQSFPTLLAMDRSRYWLTLTKTRAASRGARTRPGSHGIEQAWPEGHLVLLAYNRVRRYTACRTVSGRAGNGG
ncbi:conserved hypothetical protein [Ricinus communis]|uniref:Uncharacterized protein n=1 Tax=Ricinus communis TaxID=3988 RepID=B9T7G6_RICCO|nr:conserved hypothetical protein [Ricinus communis]